jgi:hypothetical protein
VNRIPFGRLGFFDQCRWHLRNWDDTTADMQSVRTMARACRYHLTELEMVYDAIWRCDPTIEAFCADSYVQATMIELAICRVYIAWQQRLFPYRILHCAKNHEFLHHAFCPMCGKSPVGHLRPATPRDWLPMLAVGRGERHGYP